MKTEGLNRAIVHLQDAKGAIAEAIEGRQDISALTEMTNMITAVQNVLDDMVPEAADVSAITDDQ